MRGKVLRGLAKHRFAQEDNEPVHVLDNVWIGSIGAACNAGALRRKGWALCVHAQKRVLRVDVPSELTPWRRRRGHARAVALQ